jgi:CBS domain-containing protein
MKLWRVDEVMTKDVVSVQRRTPYREIVDLLINRRISAVPVVTRFGQVVGVVSEADLLHKVEADGAQPRVFASLRRHGRGAKAAGRTAEDLMSAPAVTVAPSLSLAAAARRMRDEHIKRLPVVDETDRLLGIFRSTADNLVRLSRQVPGVVAVADDLRYDIDDSYVTGSTIGTPFGVA